MKKTILTFVIGMLVGGIFTAGMFLIFKPNQTNNLPTRGERPSRDYSSFNGERPSKNKTEETNDSSEQNTTKGTENNEVK